VLEGTSEIGGALWRMSKYPILHFPGCLIKSKPEGPLEHERRSFAGGSPPLRQNVQS
jgi:hypothetical protein